MDWGLEAVAIVASWCFKCVSMAAHLLALDPEVWEAETKALRVAIEVIVGQWDCFFGFCRDGFVPRQNLNLNNAQELLLKRCGSRFGSLGG